MKLAWMFCGFGCGAVKTFGEEQTETAEVSHCAAQHIKTGAGTAADMEQFACNKFN
jgi:hypothetical protein